VKKLFYIFWTLAGLVVVLMLISFFFERHMGDDVTQLEIRNAQFSFRADRDGYGVWKAKVQRTEDLWFAFGYLQMHDRESQMDLLRAASLGKLSALVGAVALPRDRIMRAAARASQREWSELNDQSLLKRAATAYVEGVEHYRKNTTRPEPVEFRLLGLQRNKMESWTPSDLLAIARYQAWQFSFDLDHEVLSEKMRESLGTEPLPFLLPRVGIDAAFYEQRDLKSQLKKSVVQPKNLPEFLLPNETLGPIESRAPADFALIDRPVLPAKLVPTYNESWAKLAASNLWIMNSPATDGPKTPLTLCNDTHLRLSWPAPLMPMQFELDGKIFGSGFTLAGVPALILGSVSHSLGQRIAWGITLANYVDSQDLFVDYQGQAKILSKSQEKFFLRDLENDKTTESDFELIWTDRGIDVSASYQDELKGLLKSKEKVPVYLDWIALRKLKSPLEFYLKRNLFLQDGMESELLNDWGYPSVNFNWIEEDAKGHQKAGHFLTGYQFARERKLGHFLASSEEWKSRRFLQLGRDRYLAASIDRDKPFFLVSANQRTANSKWVDEVSYSWETSTRGNRILQSEAELRKDITFSQVDYYPPQLIEFFQRARSALRPKDICQIGTKDEREFCFRIWNRLAKWSGSGHENSWEMTVLSLWMSLTKQSLWPKDFDWKEPKKMELFVKWSEKAFADTALLNLMADIRIQKNWESQTRRLFAANLGELFSNSLRLLIEKRGPSTSNWSWGSVHRVDWYYPLGEAPEPWGRILEESLLGPPISVGGGFDNPGSNEFRWSPLAPTEFPAVHGASIRACYSFAEKGPTQVRWAVSNGPSGNPFSIWSRKMASASYFKKKLVEAK
jgi:acyl-homoserine lactone acylase PvdQ